MVPVKIVAFPQGSPLNAAKTSVILSLYVIDYVQKAAFLSFNDRCDKITDTTRFVKGGLVSVPH